MIFLILIIIFSLILKLGEASLHILRDGNSDKISGEKNFGKIKKHIKNPDKYAHPVKALTMIMEFIGAALSVFFYNARLSSAISFNWTAQGKSLLSAAIIIIIYSFVVSVFCETIPAKLAAKAPEKILLRLRGILSFAAVLTLPFVKLSEIISKALLYIMGVNLDSKEDSVTEEEILMMSDAGAESGAIDEDENRIIKNVFAFDDMTAEQICTHRTDVSVLWAADPSNVWEETIHRTRHSVFPICGENVDNVIGILNAKDYFRLEDKSKENIMASIVREPYFVHENMKADRLFAQMKQNGADHFAVVVDEYGGMSGIITVTDLVEELVGDFAEADSQECSFEKTGDNLWIIPGITDLSDVAEELEIPLPEDKYDTFGGYVIALLGEIPKDGTQVHLNTEELTINIMEIRNHRIEKCRVSKRTEEESADQR